jgi:type II secretory pathway pseudopilin PulG
VDILLASVAGVIFASAGVTGGVTAATVISLGLLPIFLGALVAIILVALALYLAVPIIIAAVLRGQSPLTTAATSGIQMALTALGLASMAGTRLAARDAAAPAKTPAAQQDKSGQGADGGDSGDEPRGMAPTPSMTPTSSGPTQAAKRRSTSTVADETGESPAERQTRILAGYEGQSTRATTSKRRVAQTAAVLEDEEKAYL